MIIIEKNIIGAVIAFAAGVGIAAINYAISRYFIKNHPSKFVVMQTVRQLIQVLYLVLVFFVGTKTPCDVTYLLIGGALGITLPMAYFTFRLVKTGKEDSTDA